MSILLGSSGYVSFYTHNSKVFEFKASAYNTRVDFSEKARMVPTVFDPNFCLVWLINDGITVEGNTVRVYFDHSGPATEFRCSLDRKNGFPCESVVLVTI